MWLARAAVARRSLTVTSLAYSPRFFLRQPILLRGGTVVNADQSFGADVLLSDGLIRAVGPSLKAPKGALVLDATGQLVLPGGVDPHTHLEMPFMGAVSVDDFASGHAAALAGGTTFHLDFVLPVAHDLLAGYAAWQRKASRGCLDYGLHVAVTSWSERVAVDMETLVQGGVNSFKFFMAYKGALMVSDAELLAGMRQCRKLGALAMVHAENGDAVEDGRTAVFASGVTGPEGHALSRPAALEEEATGRAIRLAASVNAPLYVVHVMSAGAAAQLAAARARGQRVVGEAVLSGLVLDQSAMWHPNFTTAAAAVMSPPIRQLAVDGVALKGALVSGILGPLGTDHCAFNSSQKAAGRADFRLIPNGVNGLGERLVFAWDALVASGLGTPMDFVRATSTAAAQAFNLYPRKGHIAVGSDADVVLFDPAGSTSVSAKTHFSKSDTNVYEGRTAQGRVTHTISRGRLLWADGALVCQPGTARFVPTPPFSPWLFSGLDAQDRGQAEGRRPVHRDAAHELHEEL